MHARVMSTNLKKATIDEAGAEWHKHLAHYKKAGMKKAYMLVDRSTGKYLSITIWESEADRQKNSASPEQAAGRKYMTEKYFDGDPTATNFEVLAVIE